MQTVQAQKNKTFSHIEKYELSKLGCTLDFSLDFEH